MTTNNLLLGASHTNKQKRFRLAGRNRDERQGKEDGDVGIVPPKTRHGVALDPPPNPRMETLCSTAAGEGDLAMLKWLRAHNCPWDEKTCQWAAFFGHIELLKWAHAHECPWDAQTFMGAAHFGNIEVLEWLIRKRCPWDSMACSAAASADKLEALQWLYGNNCPWNRQGCFLATTSEEIRTWITEQQESSE